MNTIHTSFPPTFPTSEADQAGIGASSQGDDGAAPPTTPAGFTRLPAYVAPPSAAGQGDRPAPIEQDESPIVPFADVKEQQTFGTRQQKMHTYEEPDAYSVSRAFIKSTLGIDGDNYVVAHFKNAPNANGKPDQVYTLTEAVMQNFPGFRQRGFVPYFASVAGKFFTGGSDPISDTAKMFHSKDVGDFFKNLGQFVFNRTGPGYVYNIVKSSEGRPEEARSLDHAYGIYKKNEDGTVTYDDAHMYAKPSQVYGKFAAGEFSEVPYAKDLKQKMQDYWQGVKDDWPCVARYQFAEDARNARDEGTLTPEQYKLVMQGGAPQLPLKGDITLDALDKSMPPDGSVKASYLDIYGYPSTNIVRFKGSDDSQVLYVPGNDPQFVAFQNDKEVGQWVAEQAKDPQKKAQFLSHFSIYNRQDGSFYSGVESAVNGMADGSWSPPENYIHQKNEPVAGDVFDDLRNRTEKRMESDMSMQTRNAADAWMDTLDMWATFLGPIGGPEQIASGIYRGVNGKTSEEREQGWVYTGMGVIGSAADAHTFVPKPKANA